MGKDFTGVEITHTKFGILSFSFASVSLNAIYELYAHLYRWGWSMEGIRRIRGALIVTLLFPYQYGSVKGLPNKKTIFIVGWASVPVDKGTAGMPTPQD